MVVAERVAVSPKADRVRDSGAIWSIDACCSTATVADPDAEPTVAVIVAVPSETAVTKPLPSTLATLAALDDQEMDIPRMTLPF